LTNLSDVNSQGVISLPLKGATLKPIDVSTLENAHIDAIMLDVIIAQV
jgi:hypothetical protein